MSLAKDNIWKLLAPLVVMGVMFLIPVPDGMPPQAWHYFAVFVAMIVGMILEPIPATAISFIAVTICVIGSNYLLFDAKELADPVKRRTKNAKTFHDKCENFTFRASNETAALAAVFLFIKWDYFGYG